MDWAMAVPGINARHPSRATHDVVPAPIVTSGIAFLHAVVRHAISVTATCERRRSLLLGRGRRHRPHDLRVPRNLEDDAGRPRRTTQRIAGGVTRVLRG